MSNIRDILTLRIHRTTVDGVPFGLRRPSALDLIEALQVSKDKPEHLHAWLVMRHALDTDDKPLFNSIADVLDADALTVQKIGRMAEELYSEGRD